MRGMRAAKAAVAARLEARVPGLLGELAADEALAIGDGDGQVALPKLYATHEAPQLTLDQWPAIVVVGQETTGLRPVDTIDTDTELAEVWEGTYLLRLFTFARAQTFAQVSADRDRLVLAVRQVLLERPSLDDALGARIVPGSIRESYSDVMPDELGRSVAAAFLEVSLDLTETIARPRLATVLGAEPTGHPAL